MFVSNDGPSRFKQPMIVNHCIDILHFDVKVQFGTTVKGLKYIDDMQKSSHFNFGSLWFTKKRDSAQGLTLIPALISNYIRFKV